MLIPLYQKSFLKDLKKSIARGKDQSKIKHVMDLLIKEIPLDPKHRNHKLKGDYIGRWECHIQPD